ncbi:MAG TPA: hypothetical protein VF669_14070 [Tepidisphaeraceae bacterium]
MANKIVWSSLRFTIVSLLSFLVLLAFVLAYQGLYLELTGQVVKGAATLASSLLTATGAALLIRYRDELIDVRD